MLLISGGLLGFRFNTTSLLQSIGTRQLGVRTTMLLIGGLLDLGVDTIPLLLSGRVHALADVIEATLISCLKLRTRALLTTSDYWHLFYTDRSRARERRNIRNICIPYITGVGGVPGNAETMPLDRAFLTSLLHILFEK